MIFLKGIKAHEFVGQSSKSTSKGQKQCEQQLVLSKFNAGVYNVLIATSIAEEGLDIAEVDLIIFFEAVSSTTRQIQREGRTGRKRSGRVVVLASNKAEEEKIIKCFSDGDKLLNDLKRFSSTLVMSRTVDFLSQYNLPKPKLCFEKLEFETFQASKVEGPNTSRQKNANHSIASVKVSFYSIYY